MASPSQHRSRRVWFWFAGIAAALTVIVSLAGPFRQQSDNNQANPDAHGSPSSSASVVDGTVVINPNVSDFAPVYTDGDKPAMVDPNDRPYLDNWLAPVLSNPGNLRNWQLCPAELRAEARATQAYADAVGKYPHNKPYNLDPTTEDVKNTTNYFSTRAQTMRAAADLAEKNNIACIDEPTALSHWLEFTVQVKGKARRVAVPDGYILLYVFETGEQITLNPSICVPRTHIRWEDVNQRPIATTVGTGAETFSERGKYEQLGQLAAEEDLERAMGRETCPTP